MLREFLTSSRSSESCASNGLRVISFELIVLFDADDRVTRFQLCYDIKEDERALTWLAESGYSHDRIDFR